MTAAAAKGELSPVARHIARSAARLFAERGYDATSVREIVEAAGVAKPTLYYYFRSKEGLAQALLTVPLTNLVAELRRIVTTIERPDAGAWSRCSRPTTPSVGTTRTAAGSSMPCSSARSVRRWPASSSRSRTSLFELDRGGRAPAGRGRASSPATASTPAATAVPRADRHLHARLPVSETSRSGQRPGPAARE